MGLLIKQLKKLFKIKEKDEMKEPNSLKNYFYLTSPVSLTSYLKNWNRKRMKCKSQLFVYGDVKNGIIHEVMSVNDYKPLWRLEFNEPTEILFYVRLSEDTSDYIIKDHCCCKHDLDSFLERHVPENILSRMKNDRDVLNKLMATWKNLMIDPTTIQSTITNPGTTKFGDKIISIRLDKYGNITTRP